MIKNYRKTKILATIGPSSDKINKIEKIGSILGLWAKAHWPRPMGQGPWAKAHGPGRRARPGPPQPANKFQKNRLFEEDGSKFGNQ